MKKRLAAILLVLALLISCFGGFSASAATYRQEDVERDIIALMEKYCGTYWYSSFGGAIQCKGFADMVFDDLFGTGAPGPYSDSRYYLPYATSRGCTCLGILSAYESNAESLKALLSQALPGDYVQCVRSSGTQHSMIVVETTDTGITFFDCNLKGSLLCASYTYTWDEVANYLTRGISLYRHNGYSPSTEYRLYFDANGGECELEYKTAIVGNRYGSLPTPERKGYIFDYWYIKEYNSSRTPKEYPVTANSTKTAYSNTYLYAHWSVDEGPCSRDGHLWEVVMTEEPTCEEDGYDVELCGVCQNTRNTNFVPALGHSYEFVGSVLPTNVEDGCDTFQCTRCGKTYSTVTVCPFNRFTDLNANSWYYPYVREMVDKGLMNGISETNFAPDATLTRAMLVTILYRMQGEPEAARAGFRDVNSGAWYEDAVNWACEAGISNGYPDNTFRPNAAITREQAATILFRFCDILGKENTSRSSLNGYKDMKKVSSYAVDAMEWANACGILSGFPDSTLRPQGSASRVQISKMLITLVQTDRPEVGVG